MKSYIGSGLQWKLPSDPEGEPSHFPFAFDPDFEDQAVHRLFDEGRLWLPSEPVEVMEVGAPLWTALLNSKVVMFYLMGSYLWRFSRRGN